VGSAFVLALVFFPFGKMKNHYFRVPAHRWGGASSQIVATREGLVETIIYLREDKWQEPLYYKLLTNGFSMSGSPPFARRYMELFVHWPIALRPQAKNALLLCFGVGSTAKALTTSKGLQSIDIVDISRDIVEMSQIVHPVPGAHPLSDPRVHLHIEDGRFFLLTTNRRFDIITAEPPPPKNAGIVNLYSREFFGLMHDRLVDGGAATYWLPVNELTLADSKAIIRAFCSVFEDCSLWNGSAGSWMLAGTRPRGEAVNEEEFERQWHDPLTLTELKAIGLETPEQLGALFIADAPFLRTFTLDQLPLEDDRPHRLSHYQGRFDPRYLQLVDTEETRRRFEQSDYIRQTWPAELRKRTLKFFEYQGMINKVLLFHGVKKDTDLAELHKVLSATELKTLPLWLLNFDDERVRAAQKGLQRGITDPLIEYGLGARAMADRDYLGADEHFAGAQRLDSNYADLVYYRALALCLAGERDRARSLARQACRSAAPGADPVKTWEWFDETFGLGDPCASHGETKGGRRTAKDPTTDRTGPPLDAGLKDRPKRTVAPREARTESGQR